MIVQLTKEKKEKIFRFAKQLLEQPNITVRILAEFIGTIISSFPASMHGPLHFRNLEKQKIACLIQNNWDYDSKLTLNVTSKSDIAWWSENILKMYKPINLTPFKHTLFCDASTTGWGAVLKGKKVGGNWAPEMKALHINTLELKAIFFALNAFKKYLLASHVKVYSDNQTAICAINKKGTSHSESCNSIA